jgi:uncharacterized protein (DUF433 family)
MMKYPLAQLEVHATATPTRDMTEVYSQSGKPYARRGFARPRAELFTRAEDSPLINISDRGRRLVLEKVVSVFLQRVDKTPIDGVLRLYPFITKDHHPDAPKSVVVDARVAFGKPVITGTGIPTAAVYQLFKAGDDIKDIADEYGRTPEDVEAAVRYESVRARRAA